MIKKTKFPSKSKVIKALREWRIREFFRYLSFFIMISTLIFLFFSADSYGEEKPVVKKENSAADLLTNPFELEKKRIVPGSIFKMKVRNKKEFDLKQGVEIELEYKTAKGKKKVKKSLSGYFKYIDDELFLFSRMPSWDKIRNIRKQSVWRGWLKPYEAQIKISCKKAENKTPFEFPVEIPYVLWGCIWGIVAVVISFVIIWALKPHLLKKQEGFAEDRSKEEWEKSSRVKRFFLYPLHFTVTPIGTYSISLTQILLWTYITIFSLVYVYWVSGSFLDITSQILMLLGIGGGTALAAKINAQSRVYEMPHKYLNLVKKTRTPKLKDLISIGGQPNIFKFQILSFTLLTGYIVVVEILKKHAFPVIPGNLVALMGISSLVYLGNEVTHKNVWDVIKKKKEAIEEHARKKDITIMNAQDIKNLGIPEVDELIRLLSEIYS